MRAGVVALTVLPLAFVALGVFAFGIDLPFLDQWAVVALLQRMDDGSLTLADLVAPHNEHRPVFPRILWIGLARATAYDINAQLWLNLALAAALFIGFVWRCTRVWAATRSPAPAWLIPLLSLLVFNFGAREHWLQGIQTIMGLEMVAVVSGFFLLGGQGGRRDVAAMAAGVVASGSMACGLLYWPVGLLVIGLVASGRSRRQRLAAWTLAGCAGILVQLLWWTSPAGPGALPTVAIGPGWVLWMLNFLGAPLMTVRHVAWVFGLASIVLFAGLVRRLWQAGRLAPAAPLLAIALFVVLTGTAISLGRAEGGLAQSVVSRYLAVSVWYWAALIALLPLAWPPWLPPRALAAVCAVTLSVHTVAGLWRGYETLYRRIEPVRAAVAADVELTDAVLYPVNPHPEQARRLLQFLRERRLSVYRRP